MQPWFFNALSNHTSWEGAVSVCRRSFCSNSFMREFLPILRQESSISLVWSIVSDLLWWDLVGCHLIKVLHRSVRKEVPVYCSFLLSIDKGHVDQTNSWLSCFYFSIRIETHLNFFSSISSLASLLSRSTLEYEINAKPNVRFNPREKDILEDSVDHFASSLIQ